MYQVTMNGNILSYWGTFSTERRAWEAIEEAIEEMDYLNENLVKYAHELYGVVKVR